MRTDYHTSHSVLSNIAFDFTHNFIQTKCIKKGFYMALIKISKLQASLSQTTALNRRHLFGLFTAGSCCVALSSWSQYPV